MQLRGCGWRLIRLLGFLLCSSCPGASGAERPHLWCGFAETTPYLDKEKRIKTIHIVSFFSSNPQSNGLVLYNAWLHNNHNFILNKKYLWYINVRILRENVKYFIKHKFFMFRCNAIQRINTTYWEKKLSHRHLRYHLNVRIENTVVEVQWRNLC